MDESEKTLDAVWCIDSETGEKVLIDRLTNKTIMKYWETKREDSIKNG